MEAKILTVHWHDGEQPVYSAHFQPSGNGNSSERLATGGGDNNVRIWRLVRKLDGDIKVEYLSTLAKHTQAVNVVRFDPKGELLATAGDDGCAMIWSKADGIVRDFGADADDDATESWTMNVLCRSSASEIYDLAWSPDSRHIITGSTDNVARVYDASNGQQVAQITDHAHYVQGVACDPRGKLLATQSADRSVHIYSSNRMNPTVIQKITRSELPTRQFTSPPTETSTEELPPLDFNSLKSSMLYHTESLRSFFRRLTFSTDGNFLLTPAGIFKNTQEQDKEEPLNTVYIYSRAGINKGPIAHLPGFKKPALVVSFSPVFYELDKGDSPGAFKLPYKMVYAVGTVDSVYVFDTQSLEALGSVSNIHYGTLTDITWNSDGKSLLVSSADGFCTSLHFGDAFGTALSVNYLTLLPEDSMGSNFETPKCFKKKVAPPTTDESRFVAVATAAHKVLSSPAVAVQTSTTKTSPLPKTANIALTSKVSPQVALKSTASTFNLINHLVKKKEAGEPAPASVESPDKDHDVIMIDDEQMIHTAPVKHKKRISPTPVTLNDQNNASN